MCGQKKEGSGNQLVRFARGDAFFGSAFASSPARFDLDEVPGFGLQGDNIDFPRGQRQFWYLISKLLARR